MRSRALSLSLSSLLPLSTARLLAPLSPPVSADPSCTDIHLFVQESPPLTIKGTNIYSLYSALMLLRVSFFFYGGGLFTSQKLLFPFQSPPPPPSLHPLVSQQISVFLQVVQSTFTLMQRGLRDALCCFIAL